MEYGFRPARPDDLEQILAVTESGRQYLQTQGLPQWQDGYAPAGPDIARDIQAGYGYVLTLNGTVCGYACLIPGPDGSPEPSEGAWDLRYDQYAAIHRVAIGASGRGRGLGGKLLQEMLAVGRAKGVQDLRIDTHRGNVIMQKVILGAGFHYIGILDLPIPNGERLAYQILLD